MFLKFQSKRSNPTYDYIVVLCCGMMVAFVREDAVVPFQIDSRRLIDFIHVFTRQNETV